MYFVDPEDQSNSEEAVPWAAYEKGGLPPEATACSPLHLTASWTQFLHAPNNWAASVSKILLRG